MEEKNDIGPEKINIISDVFKSKAFKIVGGVILFLIILLITFSFGVHIGFEKANFSYNWRDNYNNNILQHGMEPPFNERFKDQNMGFINSNGSAGEIIMINNDGSLVIKDIDNTEKIVIIDDDTTIRMFNQNVGKQDLKVGQKVVIIGEPNSSGEIEAKLIRIMPEPLNK